MVINLKNVSMYLLGLVIMSLGVTLMKLTNIGLGSWDAVIHNFSYILKIPMGIGSLIVNVLLLSFVMIYRKSFKYITVIIPILINMLFLLFWGDFVFVNVVFNTLWSRIGFFIVSLLLLPLSLALMIKSTLPKMIYDEITFILIELFKAKNFGFVRLGFEIFALLLAMVFGLIAGNILMQVGPGTILVTLSLGNLINIFLKLLKYEENTTIDEEEIELESLS